VAADPVYMGVAWAGVGVRGMHGHLLAIRGDSLRVAHEACGARVRHGSEIGDAGANGPGWGPCFQRPGCPSTSPLAGW
jgi:hypothetical protein